jgi:hypothetical protein
VANLTAKMAPRWHDGHQGTVLTTQRLHLCTLVVPVYKVPARNGKDLRRYDLDPPSDLPVLVVKLQLA